MMMEILVDIAELMAAANSMSKAKDIYEDAITNVKNAADELAGNWEGDGQVAFVADQAQAYTYYRSLIDIALDVIENVKKTAEVYSDSIARRKSLMGS